MNSLVSYGPDSDEDSPRKKSFDDGHARSPAKSPKPRRDSDVFDDSEIVFDNDHRMSPSPRSDRSETVGFAEPPPPKRPADVHSPSPAIRTPLGMPRISSVASLVSYSGDTGVVEDSFEKAERINTKGDTDSPASGMAEPRPPERVSQDDSDDENERLIDQALEEGITSLKEDHASSSTPTPQREQHEDSPKTPRLDDLKMEEEGPVEMATIPPEPDLECDPKLQEKIEGYFDAKNNGVDLNRILQNRKDFLNPSCYQMFIERFELDEKGSNFRTSIFDPHGFPDNCFYDKIGEEQAKLLTTQKYSKDSKKVSINAPLAKKPKV